MRPWASLILLGSAALWGVAWWPMKQLAGLGVSGAALALLSYGSVGVLSLPWLWRERRQWWRWRVLLALIAASSGWAAVSFILAMTEGDVVREMLLFYLSPAWSVLGARFLLHEPVGLRRAMAVASAIAGAFCVIRASGAISLATVTAADLLALGSGVSFAAGNLLTRAAAAIPLASKSGAQMLGCALLAALVLLAQGRGLPELSTPALTGVAAFALIWIVGGTVTTSFGVSHLEAGRASLIILAELVAAVVSASLIDRRVPLPLELLGGVLILSAAVIDARPMLPLPTVESP